MKRTCLVVSALLSPARNLICATVSRRVKVLSLIPYLLAVSTLACGGRADIPGTPDLSELLQNYDNPTAQLDDTTVAQALQSSPSLQELSDGFDAADYIMDDVDDTSAAEASNTGSRLRLQGSIALHIRCPGELAQPNFDEDVNGSISFTLALADNRIRRSFAGEATACVMQGNVRGTPARIVLDGPIAFDVGGDIGIGQRWTGELLASLPGELTVAGIVFKSVSVRRTADGRFQHLVRMPPDDKTVVFELSAGGITIRDGAGVWFCADGEPCARR